MHVRLVLLREWKIEMYHVIPSRHTRWILGVICEQDDIAWLIPEPLLKRMVKPIIMELGELLPMRNFRTLFTSLIQPLSWAD